MTLGDQSAPPAVLGDVVVHSPRALYETYNFHEPDALEQLAAWLARAEDDDGAGVAVVAGRPGSGRDYFVRAAAWMAGERGAPVRHARLSFDGFDPDGSAPLLAFAEHQMRLQLGAEEEPPAPLIDRKALLAEAAGLIPGGYLGAAAVSFLLKAAISAVDVRALLQSTVPLLPGPRASSQDHLRAVLDFATRRERLVLVLPADELPEPVVQWFVHEPRRNGRLSVVLSVARVPSGPVLYGEPLGLVAELGQMTPQALRERIAVRFAPNEFPDRFFSGLWKRTQGVPGQVALVMMHLEHGGLVTRGDGPGSPWHLIVDPAHPGLVEYFAGHFYDQLNQIRDQQRPIDLHLVRFVELAALCGSIAPPRLIASYMGLTDAERDDLLDRVDELEEAGRPVFTSIDYRHPTFRNKAGAAELVYRFADESNRLIVLRRMMHKATEARGFLAWMATRIPISTRGAAELFSSLATYLEEGSPEREEYAHRLQWWTTEEDAEALRELLSTQARAGKVSSAMLWAVAQSREEWPSARRLALLDAMQDDPDGIPLNLLASYHYTRSHLLYALGRFEDALQATEAGIDGTQSDDYPELARLHAQAHLCSKVLHRLDGELWHAREQYRVAPLAYGPCSPRSGAAVADVASSLIRCGRADEARPYVEQAFQVASPFLDGEADEDEDEDALAILMNCLGSALFGMEDYPRACVCYRRVVEYRAGAQAEQSVCDSNAAVDHYNLGSCLWRVGEEEEAREHLATAVRLALEKIGTWHISYAGSLLELLVLDLRCGDHKRVALAVTHLRELIESGEMETLEYLRGVAARLRGAAPSLADGTAHVDVRHLFTVLARSDSPDVLTLDPGRP